MTEHAISLIIERVIIFLIGLVVGIIVGRYWKTKKGQEGVEIIPPK